jgi:DNA invertase Pin-like site-specific DNA recombinase
MEAEKQKYLGYSRVSTARQGESKLSLEHQEKTIREYVDSQNGILVEIKTDIESGSKNDRRNVIECIAECQENNYIMVISRLDRLSRDVTFLNNMIKSQVKFVVLDMREATPTTLLIMSVIAQEELTTISNRIKYALESKRLRGEKWNQNNSFSDEQRQNSITARKKASVENENNIKAAELITLYIDKGLSYNAISKKLNENKYKTSRGCKFSPVTVSRLYKRTIDTL